MEAGNSDRTPSKLQNCELSTRKTPISTPKSFASRFLLLSSNRSSTPSPSSLKQHLIVRNPFENNQVHERLHLPVISSPSLFHAPSTPKNTGNKLEVFEWTIEELSNLNPVNVVPHETQFRIEETDPDKEAQVQAAINSFFKEQQIVPSPLNCLRRKFELNLGGHPTESIAAAAAAITSANKKNATTRTADKRDMTTQTALSFPPNLPREIEDLLKQYRTNDECNINNDESETSSNSSMMDISTLRRKLFMNPLTPEQAHRSRLSIPAENFGLHLTLNSLSPPPRTPELSRLNHRPNVVAAAGTAIDSSVFRDSNDDCDVEEGVHIIQRIDSNLFGELSPIGVHSSANSSPIMSSSTHDISMASDFGAQDSQTPTGSRQRCNKLKKKRLSDSFSMLHNEDSLTDKENDFEFHPAKKEREGGGGGKGGARGVMFHRYDSGFRDESTINLMNCSAEFA